MSATLKDSTRQLGFWMCVALVMGNMIGNGIFMLPASLAPFGMNSVIAWLLTAGGAIILAYVFAGLSRAFPDAAGPYAYTQLAFGDLTGFVGAWGYWISVLVGNAALATGAIAYLSNLFPLFAESTSATAIATLAVVWLFTAINIHDVRSAGKVQIVTTALKLIPLLAVIGLAVMVAIDPHPVLAKSSLLQTPLKLDSITAAATMTLWALLGFESASIMADRVRDPIRNIPRATMIGTLLTAAIYIITSTTIMLLIPSEQLAHSNAPFADVARLFWGDTVAHWLALFVVISGLGCLNGQILMQGELPLQMAKKGAFPAYFSKLSARQTPASALYLGSVLITVLVLMNFNKSMVDIYTFMLLLSTTATLVTYLLCALAVLVLLRNGKLVASQGRAASLGIAGVIGTGYALWTLIGAGYEAVLWGFVLLVLGIPVFYYTRSKRSASTGNH